MASSDGKVVIDVNLNEAPAERGIKNLGGSLKSGLGKAAGVAIKGTAVAIGAVGTAIGTLTKKSYDAYSSYEQLVGGVDTLFKKSSQRVQKYADEAYKTAGLSANEYMDTVTSFSASLLQGLKGNTKEAADKANMAIIDMSDNANKMGTDMQMIQNAYQGFAKQNYTMLDNLKLGYGGTAAEMARLVKDSGVLGKEGEKLTAKNLNEKVSFDQMVDAIHKVQTEMGITGTTSLEAATTLEGSFNSMKSAWENFTIALGTGDDAKVKETLDLFVKSFQTLASNAIPRIKTIIESIGTVISQYLPELIQSALTYITSSLPNVIETLLELTGNIVSALKTSIGDNLGNILSAASMLIDTLTQGLLSATEGSSSGFADVITQIFNWLINSITQNLPLLIQAFFNVVSMIQTTFVELLPTIVNTIMELIPQLINTLMEIIPQYIESTTQMFVSFFGEALPQLIEGLLLLLPQVIDSLCNGLIEAIPMIIDAAISLLMGIVDAIPIIIQALVTALPLIIESIINVFVNGLPTIIQGAIKLLMGLVDAIPTVIISLVEAIPTIINSICDTLLNNMDSIINAGMEMFSALVEAIPTAITKIVAAIPKIITSIIKAISKAVPKILKLGVTLFVSLIKNLPEIILKLGKGVVSIVTGIIKGFKDSMGEFTNLGIDLMKGMADGFTKAFSYIGGKVKDAGNWVVGKFKGIFGIHSPSKVMREQVGKYVAEGVVVGYEDVDPFGQIQKDLDSGVASLTLSAQNEMLSNTNLMQKGFTESMVTAIKKSNLGIYVGEKQFGRLVERGLASL